MTEPFDLAEADPDASRPRVELKPGQKLALSVQARDAYDLGEAPHVGGSPRFQLDVVTASELRALLEKRELGLRQRFEAIYEKMVGVRDLVDRIDLAASGDGADDDASASADASGDEPLTPERRRERDLARLGGARQSAHAIGVRDHRRRRGVRRHPRRAGQQSRRHGGAEAATGAGHLRAAQGNRRRDAAAVRGAAGRPANAAWRPTRPRRHNRSPRPRPRPRRLSTP